MNINLKKFIEKQMLLQKPLNEGEVTKNTNYSLAYKWLSEYLSNNLDTIVAAYEKSNTIGGSRGMDMTKVLNTVCNKLDEYSKKISESKNFNGKPLNEGENLNEDDTLFEDILNEDDDVNESAEDKKMTEEELKIESLKIATNIAKLMSDVTTDDIITIADKVSGFIRDHQIGSEETKSEESDIAADLELPSDEESSEEKPEENKEEKPEEKPSDKESSEEKPEV